jgi:hypothetical protein
MAWLGEARQGRMSNQPTYLELLESAIPVDERDVVAITLRRMALNLDYDQWQSAMAMAAVQLRGEGGQVTSDLVQERMRRNRLLV